MESALIKVLPLLLGYLLDLLIGDPEKFPHPIRLFGNTIAFGTKMLNHGIGRFWKGGTMTFLLTGTTFFVFYHLNIIISDFSIIAGIIFKTLFVYWGIANQNLIKEGKDVFRQLQLSLEAGRKQLSRIVGRNTEELNEQQIKIAVLETMSENLSDGVIAPLFYYALGGIPAMMTYKIINTLDSMIGYQNEKYEQFGKVAARIDDIANFIPARLTALILCLVGFSKKGLVFIFKFGHQHKSPNAGFPEAALAGILDCRFGGPNYYHGKLVEKPFIGTNDRKINDHEINTVIKLNHLSTLLSVVVIIYLQILLY